MEQDFSARARKRAHGILLSESGDTIEEIADLYFVTRDTVSVWIDAWEQRGIDGLYDHPRSGRPTTLKSQEEEQALTLLKQFPRRITLVIQKLEEQFGKTVSQSTMTRLARQLKGKWTRVRRSRRSQRDQKQFDAAKVEREQLRRRQQRREIDLFSFDECGFTLEPPIPYAWQFPDEQIELPSSKSRRLNVLGFLSPDNTFHSFVCEWSITSEVVIACFDYLSEQIMQETWVVLDNASIHTSDAFEECLPRWKAKGLFIQRTPAYSPELNLIEMLWHLITYFWLPFSAYESFGTLVDAVEDILRHIGTTFRIHFKEVAMQGSTL